MSRWLVLAVVSAAQFLCVLDLWVVNIALPALQREFAPATLADAAWILNVYAILLAGLLVPTGRLADNLGRRRFFLLGLMLFGSASLGCALAPTLPILIGWRVLQAVGAAVLLPTTLGLALPAFAPHERGTAVGVWAGVGAVAAGSGPVLGGLLVAASWRWIFLINLPILVATLAAAVNVLPRDARRTVRPVDPTGSLLLLGAVGLICGGLIEAPAWPPLLTTALVAGGLVLAAIFVGHALRNPSPVVPPHLFTVRRFSVSALGLLAYYVGFAALLLGTTLLLTERLHLSVLEAALGIAPGPITAGVISPFSGRLARRIGVRSMVLVGAGAFGMSALWPLLSTGETTSYVLGILPSMLLWGVANACIQPTLFAAADAVPKGDVAVGAAVLTVTRQLGSALGVTVLVLALGTEDQASFRNTWSIVLVAAGLTAVAGVLLEQCPPLAEITRGTAAVGSPAVARARLRPSGGPGLRSGRA